MKHYFNRISMLAVLVGALLVPGAALAQGGDDGDGDGGGENGGDTTTYTLGPDEQVTVTVPASWVLDETQAPVAYTLASSQDVLESDDAFPGGAAIIVALFPREDDLPLAEALLEIERIATEDFTLLNDDALEFSTSESDTLRAVRSNQRQYEDERGNTYLSFVQGVENSTLRVVTFYLGVTATSDQSADDPATDPESELDTDLPLVIFDSLTLAGELVPPPAAQRLAERLEFDGLLGVPSLALSVPEGWVFEISEDGAALDLASNPDLLEVVRTQPISEPTVVDGAGIAISILDKGTFGGGAIALRDLWDVLAASFAAAADVTATEPEPTFIGDQQALQGLVEAPAGTGSVTVIETETAYLLVIALGNPAGEFDAVLAAVVDSITTE